MLRDILVYMLWVLDSISRSLFFWGLKTRLVDLDALVGSLI